MHRTARNAQQKAGILSDNFDGWKLDPVLTKLDGPAGLRDPEFRDPRYCLVFWARPPPHVRSLIAQVQQKLKTVAPGLWLMPQENLHMTAMEVTHSLTAPEIDELVAKLQINDQHKIIADLPCQPDRRARLIRPMVGFDAAALALSFVPDAGDDSDPGRFTYHHLRRELHENISAAGVKVGSRYVVPSAHLTIARFNSPNPFAAGGQGVLDAAAGNNLKEREKLMESIEAINQWLADGYWAELERGMYTALEWTIGEGKGLDFRKGTLWYGGGESIYLGKSIDSLQT